MSELEEAVTLAMRLLDEPNADPDDDLRMLSRQLLRSDEAVARLGAHLESWKEYAAALKAIYEIHTKMFQARLGGTIRDTKTESEFMRAALRLEKTEENLAKARGT